MVPLAYAGIALGAAVVGYLRFEQIKVGDLVQVAPPATTMPPIIIKVTSKDKDYLRGTVIDANTNTDTMVPVTVDKKKVLKNLTPRFSLFTSQYW